jgi:hypothetical protein
MLQKNMLTNYRVLDDLNPLSQMWGLRSS